jgi:hypothetical protein
MWVAWEYEFFRHGRITVSLTRLALEPRLVYRFATLINESGTWRYGDTQVVKGDLLALWIGEAAIILSAGVLLAWQAASEDEPICRACGEGCVRVPDLPRFGADRQADFIAAIENRDFAYLASQPAPTNEIDPELALRLMGCPACHETNILTVRHMAWYRDSKTGRRTVQGETLINGLLLTPAEMADLVATCLRIIEQRSAPESDAPSINAS